MSPSLHALAESKDGKVLLRSPEVGTFTRALPRGTVLTPGGKCGVIHRLDVAFEVLVPAGVTGRVVSPRPELIHAPVDYGAVLYELAPLTAEDAAGAGGAGGVGGKGDEAGLVFRAPYSGRLWHRPSPGDPPFVQEGDVIEVGRTIGLIEVMKTFTHLSYEEREDLPAKARVKRVLVGDGEEVTKGDGVLELDLEGV